MIFALLLFGCADDGGQCEQLAAPPRHYEAKVLCEADAEMALQSDIALRADYPTVEARCQPVGADASVALSTGDPDEGRPVASIRLAVAQPRPR
jgi:hypothetical protein